MCFIFLQHLFCFIAHTNHTLRKHDQFNCIYMYRVVKILNVINFKTIFTARSSYASADLRIVILSLCQSVRPSVTRVLCDETKKSTAKIFIPHERIIHLVFWYHNRLVGDVRFHLKFALKVTTPFKKRRLRQISAYNVSTVRASEKCSIIANRKSTTRFSTSYRWSAYIIPNSPKGWLKNRICRFCE